MEEYNQRLTDLYGLVSGDIAADTILPAGIELLAEIKNRIQNEGKNSAGGRIGSYSTKPLYASAKSFIKGGFTPQGKPGAQGAQYLKTHANLKKAKATKKVGSTFISGVKLVPRVDKRGKVIQLKNDYSEHKSMYLARGYEELRAIQGLRIDTVNLRYSGNLMDSYQLQKIGQYVILGLTEELSVLKKEGMEKKYGYVFNATSGEIERYVNRASGLFARLTRGMLAEGFAPQPVIEQ